MEREREREEKEEEKKKKKKREAKRKRERKTKEGKGRGKEEKRKKERREKDVSKDPCCRQGGCGPAHRLDGRLETREVPQGQCKAVCHRIPTKRPGWTEEQTAFPSQGRPSPSTPST